MYAIALELETETLRKSYPNASRKNADDNIADVLLSYGFEKSQAGLFLGGEGVSSVQCVLAVQQLNRTFPWFKACVRQISMLRIGEIEDLRGAL